MIYDQYLGYKDMGVIWREELEIPNLKSVVNKLLYDIKPLYTALHAVTRHVLKEKYDKMPYFERDGMIPADIFGECSRRNLS